MDSLDSVVGYSERYTEPWDSMKDRYLLNI
jgi:hypothetical protein